MKFFSILTAAICALTLGVNAAPPSYGSSLEPHLESRGSGSKGAGSHSGGSRPASPDQGSPSAGLAKLKSIQPGMVAGQTYAFMLTVANGGQYDIDGMEEYCLRVGYKHKSLIVGKIEGQDFKATEWDLTKAKTTMQVSVGKREWMYAEKARYTYKPVGTTNLSDNKILALAREVQKDHTRTYVKKPADNSFDCATFVEELIGKMGLTVPA
ncbi:hypothetical protein MMC30_001213 [Trapelia coarctata]|nr:hypothetical protein [Trapelia coarctata]